MFTLATLAACFSTACPSSEEMKHRLIRNPTGSGIILAPDLYTLRKLSYSNFVPPNGAAVVPNGTKARLLERKFLKEGLLVEPYAANSFDMIRDKAIEVELIEVREGRFQFAVGWVPRSCLQPEFLCL
jgi:hypothetical protein